MSRYIDADELKDAMLYGMCGTGYQTEALMLIEEVPIVEIVRCKECKYWNDAGLCKKHSSPIVGAIYGTDADDYCSEGESKEQEHE